MSEPAWLNDDERQAWRNFTLMQLQLFALLGRELADADLSYQDYVVLADLSESADEQARLTELARRLGWEKSRLSHHVTRMAERGLIERVRCPTDQRGWFVRLTERGRQAIRAAAPDHVSVVRRHFIDVLTPDQLRALNIIAQTVLEHMPT